MPSKTIDIHDERTPLSQLVSFALEGIEVIISEGNKPVARLVPVEDSASVRIAGMNQGEIWTSDDFDEPLPESFWTGVL